MGRKGAPGDIHKKEDTGRIHELEICQAGTTHEMPVKHLELLITFIKLGCAVELSSWVGGGAVCTCTYVDKVRLCLPVCAGILAAPWLCVGPGDASGACAPNSPHWEHFWINPEELNSSHSVCYVVCCEQHYCSETR